MDAKLERKRENSRKSSRTYYQKNREKILAKCKVMYQNNKEAIKKRCNERYHRIKNQKNKENIPPVTNDVAKEAPSE